MSRVLLRVLSTVFALMWLVYVSPIGLSCCLGLMTHDLPRFCAPILQAQFFLMVGSLFGIPACALVFWTEKRTPMRAAMGIMASLVAPSCILWRPDWWPLCKAGLLQSTVHLNALNGQIARYWAKNGTYPAALNEISGQQKTGMVCSPRIHYRLMPTTSPSGGYELKIPTLFGLGFDCFFFWPSQQYPKSIYGGEVELIKTPGGVWAYVHE